MEAMKDNSQAMQTFSDKNIVSALKKKNFELAADETDVAPAAAPKVAFSV